MSVGVSELDADHKLLMELVATVDEQVRNGTDPDVMTEVVEALSEYVDYHFTREEMVLAAVGYPLFVEHKESHERLRRQVEMFAIRLRAREDSVQLAEMSRFLYRWLYEHILGTDRAFSSYCRDDPRAKVAAGQMSLELYRSMVVSRESSLPVA